VAFYTSIFPNSHTEDLNRSTDAGPGEPGSVLSGTFVLDGNRFIGKNVQIGYTQENVFEAMTPS
jgi:predicted 3-demethylubiquinone-9 3-methyltransferase (glyoxalase superfamily)